LPCAASAHRPVPGGNLVGFHGTRHVRWELPWQSGPKAACRQDWSPGAREMPSCSARIPIQEVPGTGLEPARASSLDPKSSASTNSATPAHRGMLGGNRQRASAQFTSRNDTHRSATASKKLRDRALGARVEQPARRQARRTPWESQRRSSP